MPLVAAFLVVSTLAPPLSTVSSARALFTVHVMTASDAELALSWQVKAAGLPEPVREYRFAPPRRWRLDLAWPAHHVAVEIDGGTWIGGRHTTGTGYAKDAEKLNEAACLDWIVLRVVPSMVDDGRALAWIERALALQET